MSNPKTPPPGSGNRLLDRLPEAEHRRLIPLLKPVKLDLNQVLYEQRGPIEYAYFPTGSVLSALVIMLDGGAIEVATVGNEGMVGHFAGVGDATSPHRVIVQIDDGALRIGADALREEAARGGPLRDLLAAYQVAFSAQVSQSAACIGLHRLEQRCCRWILMTRDRTDSDDVKLTHEYLAIMLGARRASVTEALRPLQESGLIRSHRGRIRLLDRAGLEALACECYRVVKDEYDRLLGDPS